MARLSEVLSLLPAAKRQWPRAWVGYTIPFLPLLASAANVKGSVTTQDGSDFIAMRIAAYSTTNAVPPVENATPQATFTLALGALKIFPDDNAQPLQAYSVSTADRRGHELEFPQLVEGNTTLACYMTNLTATDMHIRFILWGVRLWSGPRAQSAL
ncbi:MAG: hypothetical protein ABJF01_17540 [bacterium]